MGCMQNASQSTCSLVLLAIDMGYRSEEHYLDLAYLRSPIATAFTSDLLIISFGSWMKIRVDLVFTTLHRYEHKCMICTTDDGCTVPR